MVKTPYDKKDKCIAEWEYLLFWNKKLCVPCTTDGQNLEILLSKIGLETIL